MRSIRSSNARVVAAALLLGAVVACSKPPVHGRYRQGLTWIEFRSNGTVQHGGLGDTAKFLIDAQNPLRLAIFSEVDGRVPGGAEVVVGQIVNPTTLEFPSGDSSIAQAFQGRWVKEDATPTTATAEDKTRDAAVIAGGWRIPGETHVLDFRADGTYQWGPSISGKYTMLGGQKLRMTFVQNGQPSGYLDQRFVVDNDELRLTAPDGVVTKYDRVK